jgi:hypothetical protein
MRILKDSGEIQRSLREFGHDKTFCNWLKRQNYFDCRFIISLAGMYVLA